MSHRDLHSLLEALNKETSSRKRKATWSSEKGGELDKLFLKLLPLRDVQVLYRSARASSLFFPQDHPPLDTTLSTPHFDPHQSAANLKTLQELERHIPSKVLWESDPFASLFSILLKRLKINSSSLFFGAAGFQWIELELQSHGAVLAPLIMLSQSRPIQILDLGCAPGDMLCFLEWLFHSRCRFFACSLRNGVAPWLAHSQSPRVATFLGPDSTCADGDLLDPVISECMKKWLTRHAGAQSIDFAVADIEKSDEKDMLQVMKVEMDLIYHCLRPGGSVLLKVGPLYTCHSQSFLFETIQHFQSVRLVKTVLSGAHRNVRWLILSKFKWKTEIIERSTNYRWQEYLLFSTQHLDAMRLDHLQRVGRIDFKTTHNWTQDYASHLLDTLKALQLEKLEFKQKYITSLSLSPATDVVIQPFSQQQLDGKQWLVHQCHSWQWQPGMSQKMSISKGELHRQLVQWFGFEEAKKMWVCSMKQSERIHLHFILNTTPEQAQLCWSMFNGCRPSSLFEEGVEEETDDYYHGTITTTTTTTTTIINLPSHTLFLTQPKMLTFFFCT